MQRSTCMGQYVRCRKQHKCRFGCSPAGVIPHVLGKWVRLGMVEIGKRGGRLQGVRRKGKGKACCGTTNCPRWQASTSTSKSRSNRMLQQQQQQQEQEQGGEQKWR